MSKRTDAASGNAVEMTDDPISVVQPRMAVPPADAPRSAQLEWIGSAARLLGHTLPETRRNNAEYLATLKLARDCAACGEGGLNDEDVAMQREFLIDSRKTLDWCRALWRVMRDRMEMWMLDFLRDCPDMLPTLGQHRSTDDAVRALLPAIRKQAYIGRVESRHGDNKAALIQAEGEERPKNAKRKKNKVGRPGIPQDEANRRWAFLADLEQAKREGGESETEIARAWGYKKDEVKAVKEWCRVRVRNGRKPPQV